MSKVVYFLGAGATKAVAHNAPLNVDLVKKAIEDFSETSEAKRLNGFLKKLYKERENPVADNQIWNLLDYIIQQGKSPSFGINLEQIIDLKNDLMTLVIQEFEKSLGRVSDSTTETFIEKIDPQKSTIISTNYDIIIDDALLDKKYNCNYGVKIRKEVPIFDCKDYYGLKRPRHDSSLGSIVNSGDIELLKIHGSLNWLYCPKCDEVDLTMHDKGVRRTLGGLHCANIYCTVSMKAY